MKILKVDVWFVAGVDVVVATPGRLLHLSEEGTLPLDLVAYLVVDEADRFMQGSLEDDLRKVPTHLTSCLVLSHGALK